MRRVAAVLLFSAILSPAASAQVTLGLLPNNVDNQFTKSPMTIVDLAHPAEANGTLTEATVRWQPGSPAVTCSDAFKLKFLRPGATLGAYETVAERGPFAATATGFVDVDLTPPVSIRAGDLIAITQLKSGTQCGGVMTGTTDTPGVLLTFNSDIPASGSFAGGTLDSSGALAVRAANSVEVLDGVIVAAGAAEGAFNSFFRTSLQLSNQDDYTVRGKLVFHAARAVGASTDPAISYVIPAHGTVTFDDVVAQMGLSGLGSFDIVTRHSSMPGFVTRVFNDLGAAGTLGFVEPVQRTGSELVSGEVGQFPTPSDPAHFRMNVGVRTLSRGATVSVAEYAPDGSQITTNVVKTYPVNYFEQVPLSQFLGVDPVANGLIRIRVTQGSIMVYGSTTDNRTNDSFVTFANRF